MDFLQSVAAYLPSAIMLILGFGLMVVEMYVPGLLACRALQASFCWLAA